MSNNSDQEDDVDDWEKHVTNKRKKKILVNTKPIDDALDDLLKELSGLPTVSVKTSEPANSRIPSSTTVKTETDIEDVVNCQRKIAEEVFKSVKENPIIKGKTYKRFAPYFILPKFRSLGSLH